MTYTPATQHNKQPCELRRGVNGRGDTVYILQVLTVKHGWISHTFQTKAEARAFHACGTEYAGLEDLS